MSAIAIYRYLSEPATIAACSILGNRKHPATGSSTSRGPSSRYSLSGGCFGCTYCEHTQNPSGVLSERYGDLTSTAVSVRLADNPPSKYRMTGAFVQAN